MPVLRSDPEVHDDRVRFVQTAGGRPGMPSPRRVNHPPFIQWKGPLVWCTLALTIGVTGDADCELLTASPFPRHWVYGPDGNLALKSGTTDFTGWYHPAFGTHSPWGDEDSPAVVAAAETALERRLSTEIMRGEEKPDIRRVDAGTTIISEGQVDSDLYMLLDGIVRVEVGGGGAHRARSGCRGRRAAARRGGPRRARRWSPSRGAHSP
jgi:hypothetical protein